MRGVRTCSVALSFLSNNKSIASVHCNDSIADDLSKNKIVDVVKAWPHGKDVTGDVSQVLLKWLESSKVDMELGEKFLENWKLSH